MSKLVTLIIFLVAAFVGTYIDFVLLVLLKIAGYVNWNLVLVIGVSLAILSPFISDRLKSIENNI